MVLEGGLQRPMETLRIGDTVLTVEAGELVPTTVLGFLDKRINQKYDFIKLILEGERSLFISQTHAMFIQDKDSRMRSIMAKDAKLGDSVFIKDLNEVTLARIVDMTMEEKLGAYVPLTTAGTLLVDGVLVSCYTNTHHWLAHLALTPLRWFPSLLLDTESSQDREGVRTVPGMVRDLGDTLGLVVSSVDGRTETSTKGEFIEQCPAMMTVQNLVSI